MECILNNIKADIDNLLQDVQCKSPKNQSASPTTASAASFNEDVRILIEGYEKCCKKLNELNEKSQIKGKFNCNCSSQSITNLNFCFKDEQNKLERELNSDIECLELKLKYLNEKFTQIVKTEKTGQMKISDYVDKLILQYQVSD